ncbi:MAG: hypothetical protein V3W41_13460 [Planctomycetota bacterium]
MFKKIFVLGGGATLVAFLLFGTSAVSHIEHGVAWMQGKVKNSVPVEYEIERARELIDKTGPEIRKVKKVIAEKQVELKYLDREIVSLDRSQTRNKDLLRTQAARLSEDKNVYKVSYGRQVSRAKFEKDAGRRLNRVRAADSVLNSKRERHAALEQTLFSAVKRLEELRTQREKLIAQVATIEAKLQETKAKKALTLDVEVDTSNLAEARSILSDCNKRLDVELQVMENNQPLLDDVELEDIQGVSITDRISAYFDAPSATSETLVSSELELEVVGESCEIVSIGAEN